MSDSRPRTLEYVSKPVEMASTLNVGAALSLSLGLAAIIFLFSNCAGAWAYYFPAVARQSGWITLTLSVGAMTSGALGAFHAPRESGWYHVAWLGYAMGIVCGAFAPLLFL
jgi:lipoprotein signal peptidase